MTFPAHVAGGELIAAAWGNAVVDGLPPIGFIGQWPGDAAPTGWLLCRGQAVSRTTYATLFALHGTRFGVGDGTTTFNLPDFRGRYPVGFNQGGSYFTIGVGEVFGSPNAIVPAHQHGTDPHYHDVHGSTGDQNVSHYHHPSKENVADSKYIVYAPGLGLGHSAGGAPQDFQLAYTTDWASNGHSHPIDGPTGYNSPFNTTWAGQDGTNRNLPPSLSINYVIRSL
jgi:microcystin-dependent protein